ELGEGVKRRRDRRRVETAPARLCPEHFGAAVEAAGARRAAPTAAAALLLTATRRPIAPVARATTAHVAAVCRTGQVPGHHVGAQLRKFGTQLCDLRTLLGDLGALLRDLGTQSRDLCVLGQIARGDCVEVLALGCTQASGDKEPCKL